MIKIIGSIFFIVFVFNHLSVYASEQDQTYLKTLILEANRQKLNTHIQWINLMHYKKSFFGGVSSQAAGKSFFLAEDGKNNPENELNATLEGFFSTRVYGEKEQHPRCQFPARYTWLKKMLQIDETKLPPADCKRFETFYDRLSAQSITVVFSSYYLNNPSSAFGHSFIRVNSKKSQTANGEHHELLDHGINYAAEVDTGNALVYAYSSIMGEFKGTFSNVPYYYKVREYNDYESRDLWGYDINLTPEEVDLLVRHTWELGSTHFNYKYFTQNCSYHVLTLLEAAAPRLKLVDQLPIYVIPGDTIRVLNQTQNVVTKVSYRPSLRSQFRHRIGLLNTDEMNVLRTLAKSRDVSQVPDNLPKDSKARILDAASDYIEYAHPEEVLQEKPEMIQWKQKLLVARAKTGVKGGILDILPPPLEAPQVGHPSGRITLEGGTEGSLGGFGATGIRLALHDLLDPGPGYPNNSQIEFLNTRMRYGLGFSKLELDELTLFRVTSLSPWTQFKKDISFKVQFGAERFMDRNCSRCLGGSFSAGPGFTVQPFGGEVVNLFTIADFQTSYAPGFYGSNLRFGMGPTLGLLFNFNPFFKALISGGYKYLVFSLDPHSYQGSIEMRYTLSSRLALNARAVKWMDSSEGATGIMLYF